MLLTIDNLRKAYHDTPIITIPSLALNPGTYWFRGINGSGKSTLLRTLAGMLPFEGSITLDGQYEVNRHPVPYRLRVNYAEAEPLYPDFLSAHDIIRFVGKAKQATSEQIASLAERLGVDTYWHKPTGTYSSGMMKKVALLMAFLGQPALILLDEPLTTIDDRAAQTLLALIQEHQARGVSFGLASHQDVGQTELVIDRVFLVENGEVY
ncbi:MAG: ABC transporter ATP-binding protein [Cytophagales bacterium]|nr:MAG: ABC transporter ATP-binding protein [Cytophagales bacterium]